MIILNEYRNSNGKLHREDGPAVEYIDGDKKWYLNGKLHREDGPAVEDTDGNKEWWLNGKELTEGEFNLQSQLITEVSFKDIVTSNLSTRHKFKIILKKLLIFTWHMI